VQCAYTCSLNSSLSLSTCPVVNYSSCLLHFRNTSLASIAFDNLDLVGRIIKPAWVNTLSLAAVCRAAWCWKHCCAIGRSERRVIESSKVYEITTQNSERRVIESSKVYEITIYTNAWNCFISSVCWLIVSSDFVELWADTKLKSFNFFDGHMDLICFV